MADLPEASIFPAGIYQIEASDPVLGGPPDLAAGEGVTNVPLQQLAQRTRWLKDEIEDRTAAAALLAEIKTVDGAGSALDADTLDGKHASAFLLAGAQAVDADTVDGKHASDFLAVDGKAVDADKLDGLNSTSFVRSDAATELNVGRGAVYIENHASDNQNGAGITLRPSSNPQDGDPGSAGAIFSIRSIGDLIRLWVGQSITSTGSNDFETKQIAANGISLTGEIGATAWLRVNNSTDEIAYGQTFSGSALRTAGVGVVASGNGNHMSIVGNEVTPSGTWRAMGSCTADTDRYASTIFVRIS
ncbi:hypothetical protein [Limimaricola cinnabarinus]|uniref:hypothetical protein n=1 Tax=Limimaricola cinnabarinus TaxID=1125964 RepID=UPI002FE2044A